MNDDFVLVNLNEQRPQECVIVNRISTTNQKYGDSLETQKYKNTQFCNLNKLKILETIDIISSSYKKIPSKYYDILNKYSNVNLIFLNADRFSRNIADASKYINSSLTKLITIIFTENDLYSNNIDQKNKMLSAICNAQMESEKLSQRQKRRINTLKEAGKYIPPIAPYGKKIIKKNNKRQICINEEEKKIIKLIEMLKDKNYNSKQCSLQIKKIIPTTDIIKYPLEFTDKKGNIITNFNKDNALNDCEIANILNEYEILKRGSMWTQYKVKSCIANMSNISNLLTNFNIV